jgi:peptide-methionine (S)-S-oxide reductase
METATLGGGCFWCLEAIFLDLRGIASVRSGYSGGTVANPSYQAVCTGTTGHAEVVQLEFEPSEISFREILEVFFATHDPTTLNRQGADVGTQYRSTPRNSGRWPRRSWRNSRWKACGTLPSSRN